MLEGLTSLQLQKSFDLKFGEHASMKKGFVDFFSVYELGTSYLYFFSFLHLMMMCAVRYITNHNVKSTCTAHYNS